MNTLSSEKAACLVNALTVVGEQLETLNNPQWLIVAQAAAALEAIRLGLLQVEPISFERRHHA